MLRVNLRYNHGNVFRPAVCGVVGNHRKFRLRIGFLDSQDFLLLHIHSGENKVQAFLYRFNIGNILYNHLLNRLGHGNVQLPLISYRLLIGLSLGAGRSCKTS